MKTEGQGNHMKVMAIDYGDARTGVAISDALGWMTGQTTVIHSWKPEKTAEEVARLLRESGAERLVMGFPRNMDDKVAGLITDGDIRRAMESSQDKFFQLRVADIMTRSPKMVSPETKITEIEHILQQYKIHSVLVVDEEKHLLGVVDSFRTML